MLTLIPDRLSLRTIRTDYWRSLNKHGGRGHDVYATCVIFGVPLAAGTAAIWPVKLVISAPTDLLPAVSLLAGVLLTAAGQVVTLRARIADSLVLSSNERITSYMRETISGTLLAALAALADALLLGILALIVKREHVWPWQVGLSGLIIAVTAYLCLTFVMTARRMYATYLEVFEDGAPLPRRRRR